MGQISAEKLAGIRAGVTMSWDPDDAFDEASCRINTEQMCQAGAHGIYTTGSTGEFYALDYQEFCRMVDIRVEICSRYDMPLRIGCFADAARKTLKLLGYAASKSVEGPFRLSPLAAFSLTAIFGLTTRKRSGIFGRCAILFWHKGVYPTSTGKRPSALRGRLRYSIKGQVLAPSEDFRFGRAFS
ncbi:MAG: dihydrodipicolinate synthase family protein [Candidatus Latescibacterota bacterium]